ncbi:hypothetical protein [Streptomyces spongiicola]|uniref:hypothetical protein n=1 Tax=Streptomyces spongiicola TaxID=1690221 RepID=UPI00142DF484|nr:hypothetical protein [Streptomyces spongiicola]
MRSIQIEVDPLECRFCRRPLEQRRWWAPKRFCNGWHRLKYRVCQVVAFVLD